jgi:hypothetical protein
MKMVPVGHIYLGPILVMVPKGKIIESTFMRRHDMYSVMT